MVEGTRLASSIRAALDEYALPVCDTTITQRQVYPQTASEGLTVFEADNAKAKAETLALIDELGALSSAFVVVTHDPAIAAHMHRTLELRGGRLEQRS